MVPCRKDDWPYWAAIRLGEDVMLLPDGQIYPTVLAGLLTPQPLDLMTTLDALQAAGSAAKDWTNYPQRMRFIGVLFRSRQRDTGLWDPPFTAEQAEQIHRGEIPVGSL